MANTHIRSCGCKTGSFAMHNIDGAMTAKTDGQGYGAAAIAVSPHAVGNPSVNYWH